MVRKKQDSAHSDRRTVTETGAARVDTHSTSHIQGYRMPAEWGPHEATWITWPQNSETWPDELDRVEETYLEFASLLSEHERVDILVNTEQTQERVSRLFRKTGARLGQIRFHVIETNDAWLRDNGPIFVTRKEGHRQSAALINWEFNSWGRKYPPWDKDNAVPGQMAAKLGLPVFEPGHVFEGGSIDVNGLGSGLTTESCLLKPARNAGLDRPGAEKMLLDYLGISNLIWLGKGIVGDDTDGHIDTITRFVNETTLVTVLEEDSKSPNYVPLRENFNRLRSARDQNGNIFEVVALPMPPVVEKKGSPLPATYANFYIANGLVVVPTFNHRNDRRALKILEELFSGRRVVGIHSHDLIVGLGAFHCITQQQPAVTS